MLKNILNKLIAYINNKFISARGQLVSDTVEITDLLEIGGILLTVNIEKAFDSKKQFYKLD